MATVHANKILTKFILLLGGHNHCVKVSSDSETVRGMGLWEFSGALRELMLRVKRVDLPVYTIVHWNSSFTMHFATFKNKLIINKFKLYFINDCDSSICHNRVKVQNVKPVQKCTRYIL